MKNNGKDMNLRFALQTLVAVLVSTTSISASAQLQLSCPLDWSALTAIDGPDQDKMIFGLKASEWTKDHVNQMLAKDAECAEMSSDPESIKQAYAEVLKRQLYPNGLASIERRDQYADAQRALAERQAEQAQVAAMQAQAPAATASEVNTPPVTAAEPVAPQVQEAASTLEPAAEPAQPAAASRQDDRTLGIGLLILAAVAGIWIWHRFVRNRCPTCKTTRVECLDETEIDRWRGTKQVSERNSRGTNTRHVQTTYVKTQFDYECQHCQAEWTKVRKEELGNHSSVGRFLSGY